MMYKKLALLATLSTSVYATEPFNMNTIHSKFENEMHSNVNVKDAAFRQYVLDALLVNESSRWNYASPLGTPVTVNYAFAGTDFGYPYTGCCVERDFKQFEKNAIVEVFSKISAVAGVTFVEVTDVADTNVILTISTNAAGAEFPPTNANDAARPRIVHIGETDYLNYLDPNRDVQPYNRLKESDVDFKHDVSRTMWAITHEIGHILGLKHTAYNDNGTIVRLLDESEENKLFSVMSYNVPVTTSQIYSPTTMKKYDVVALQHLYGAPAIPVVSEHYEYDDTFSFHQMIVDADGHDTLSVVNSVRDNVLDLRSGAFSSIAPNPTGFYNADIGGEHLNRSHNSLSIGFDTVIEDAVGGSGNDILIGNDIANSLTGNGGNDFLTGHGENDELNGGSGFDTAVYLGYRADYTITYEDGYVTVDGADGLDKLVEMEAIQFADETLVFNSAPVITLPENTDLRSEHQTSVLASVVDADDDEITYSWTQVGGDELTLDNTDTTEVSITAPVVTEETSYTLQLEVTDGKDTVTETTVVNVIPNNLPVVSIADTQTVDENTSVSVSVEATDADNDNLTYRWVVNGATVTLTGDDTATVTFTAPNVSSDTTLTVEAFVSDGFDEVSASTTVTVKNVATNTGSGTNNNNAGSTDSKSGGGSFGWMIVMLGCLLTIRRKSIK